MKSSRKFGVEIEFCTYEDIYVWKDLLSSTTGIPVVDGYGGDYSGWTLVSDGSVDGWELVSPILRGKNGLEQVAKMVKALRKHGAKMDESCGLHVHVSAGDFSFANLMTAIKRYEQHEHAIDQAVAEHRRLHRNHYAEPMKDYVLEVTEQARSKKQLREILGLEGIDRYAKLNICSYVKHGTLEFRHHEGTLDLRKMLSWIKFCVRFMDDVRKEKSFKAPAKARKRQRQISAQSVGSSCF